MLFEARGRRFKVVLDDRLALVDAHVVELAQLLLDHAQVVLGVRVQNAVAVVFFLLLILSVYDDLLLFEFLVVGLVAGGDVSCHDLARFLEVVLGVGLDLGVAGAALVAVTFAVERATGGRDLLERLHLAVTAVVLRVSAFAVGRLHHDGGQRAGPLVGVTVVMGVDRAVTGAALHEHVLARRLRLGLLELVLVVRRRGIAAIEGLGAAVLLQVVRAEVPAELLHEEVGAVLLEQLAEAELGLFLLAADVFGALAAGALTLANLEQLVRLLLLLLDVDVVLLLGGARLI